MTLFDSKHSENLHITIDILITKLFCIAFLNFGSTKQHSIWCKQFPYHTLSLSHTLNYKIFQDTFYEIIIQCPKDDTTKLEEALKKTKVIDWEREVIVPYAPQNVVNCLRNIAHEIGVEEDQHDPLETFILEEAKYDDVR